MELLVVIAVIVMLAAIMFPVYELAAQRAECAVCMTNLKNIVTAAHIYADDHDGFLVPARVGGGPPGTQGVAWDVLLQPYLRSALNLICPSDPHPSTAAGFHGYPRSYGINHDVALVGGYNGAVLPLAAVGNPAATVLFFDLRGTTRTTGAGGSFGDLDRVDARHGDGANYAFVAGNVKWLRPEMTLATATGFTWWP